MEWSAIAALAGMSGAAIAALGFWLNFSERVSKANARAQAAEAEAQKAMEAAKAAGIKVEALATAFGIYREQVAREYVSYDRMKEFVQRLSDEIGQVRVRFDRFLERQREPERSD